MSDAALRKRFGKLLDGCGQMFWELDRSLTVVYANNMLKGVFGDPVGEVCHQFMAGMGEICPDCPVQKVFDGAERATSERMRIGMSGEAVWLQHTATPIRNEAGEIIGASELTVDVTHRKQMEEELRDSERRYRSLVEQVPDIIFSLDAEGRFAFVNTEVEKFLGYPVQKILETPLRDHVIEEDRCALDGLRSLGPEEIWDEELGIQDAAGNKHFARIRMKASFDDEDRLAGFEGVMRDRTARRKLEVELMSSKKALLDKIKIIDELYEHIVMSGRCEAVQEHTAEVAHELRQPLAIVGGFARRMEKQLNSEGPQDTDMMKKYVRIVVSEIQRLERILDGLIDFTKRDKVLLQHVNPNELIEYILTIAEGRAKEKGICFNTKLGQEIVEVSLDPGRFQQLILNLISNAIEATPTGGVVEVETGASIPSHKALQTGKLKSDGYFEIKIRNGGPRIPDDELKRIFNPFFTTKEHGTGLGLTVSKKIVEDHAGSISVRSDEDGTVFTVWLPLIQGGAGIPQAPPPGADVPFRLTH